MNDEWDDFDRHQPPGGLRARWRAWREYRRIVAEEKRELKRIQTSEKNYREGQEVAGASVARRGTDASGMADSTRNSELSTDQERLPAIGGMFSQLRQSAEMRRQLRAEKKAIDADLSENRRITARMIAAEIGSELLRLRIPQWLVAMTPSIVMIVSVLIPAVSDSETHASEHIQKLSEVWKQKIAAESWQEAELCGTRILESGIFGIDDDLRYFECLTNLQDLNRGLLFLRSCEARVPASDLAKFRFLMAEQIIKLPNSSSNPVLRRFAVTKLRDSLAGSLTEEQETRARQLLANVAIVQGNFAEAVRFLEPVANQSPAQAADVIFLKYNMATDDQLSQLRATASQALVNLETRNPDTIWKDVRNIQAKLRLMTILDREKEARQWLGSLRNIDESERQNLDSEIDKLSLIADGRKRPIQSDSMWKRLEPLMQREPENPAWTRLALRIWATDEASRGTPADRWFRSKLASDSTDLAFLREASMICHMNGRWPEARECYQKLIEKEPDDASALNNLAGFMYKFPPRDLNDSLRLVDRAVKLAPNNLVILETRGQILARMGKYDEARQILEKSLPVLPREWNLHNTLAQIYDRMGDQKNAEAHRNVLKTIPKPKDADIYANLADFR